MNLLNDELMMLNKRFFNLNQERYYQEEDGIYQANQAFEDMKFDCEPSEDSYLRNCNHITFSEFSPSKYHAD